MTDQQPGPPQGPTQEQRILEVMRRVLTQIVRELTPEPGVRHPLSDATIEDVRQALGLISARERELLQSQGQPEARPRYVDEPVTSTVVQFQPRRGDDEPS